MSVKQLTREQFRQQYLASLELENANAAKNLAANKLFTQTGQATPVEDTRTITEKLADIEGLKVLFQKQLEAITDKSSAGQIVRELDPDSIKYAYQNFGALEKAVKERYKFGVPKDIFIPFLKKFMADTGAIPLTEQERVEIAAKETAAETAKAVAPIASAAAEEAAKATEAIRSGSYYSNYSVDNQDLDYYAGMPARDAIKEFTAMKKELKRQLDSKVFAKTFTDEQRSLREELYADLQGIGRSRNDYIQFFRDNADKWDYLMQILNEVEGAGMKGVIKGKGLVAHKNKAAFKGLLKTEPIPFGRYKINPIKLEDGIVSIVRPGGGAIPQLPQCRVSKPVLHCVKTIAGGQIPSAWQINDLDDNDRIYLANLVKQANLHDQISVPTPNKDRMQKEMNRFEILKGQILAGNDSKELVKEFKALLMRFGNQGRVPKAEVRDILETMLSYGL